MQLLINGGHFISVAEVTQFLYGTTISDIEIWDTYIKKILYTKCNCVKFTRHPTSPFNIAISIEKYIDASTDAVIQDNCRKH